MNKGADSVSLRVQLSPKKILFVHLIILLVLLVAHVIVIANGGATATEGIWAALDRRFDFAQEQNFPTSYSVYLLFLAALLLFVNYRAAEKIDHPMKFRWLIMAILFCFLACDEGFRIHERVDAFLKAVFKQEWSAAFSWRWVVPYAILAAGVGIYMLPLLGHLTKRIRNLFIVSAVLYVGGALGLEMLEGYYLETQGMYSTPNLILYTLEETFEMLGIIIFSYALLCYQAPSVLQYHVHTANLARNKPVSADSKRESTPVTH